jgi:hypothetical protein
MNTVPQTCAAPAKRNVIGAPHEGHDAVRSNGELTRGPS